MGRKGSEGLLAPPGLGTQFGVGGGRQASGPCCGFEMRVLGGGETACGTAARLQKLGQRASLGPRLGSLIAQGTKEAPVCPPGAGAPRD